jgi:hypothetical protein
MKSTVELFREWCGDDEFAKFVRALQTTCKRQRRLVFWQESVWARFCEEKQVSLPQTYEDVAKIFASVSEVGPEFEYVFPEQRPDQRLNADGLRDAMLQWAAKRRAAGLDLEAVLTLRVRHEVHTQVADLVEGLLLNDPPINSMFRDSTVSVLIKPPGEDVPGKGMTIRVDDLATRGDAGSTSLRWGIAERQRPKPWWKFWT